MLEPYTLTEGTHGIILGQTGTGKSTLARYLLHPGRRTLIVDPKLDYQKPSWMDRSNTRIVSNPDRVAATLKRYNVIYRPSIEYIGYKEYDPVWRAAYEQGDLDVYNDELALVTEDHNRYGPYLRALYQQGRSRGITALGVSQRPAYIPRFCFSEVTKIWCFRLILEDDRKRVREWIGDSAMEHPLHEHGFHYMSVFDKEPGQFYLRF